MVLLSLPGTSFPEVRFWKPDKFAHIGLFGMQAILLWIALAASDPAARNTRSRMLRQLLLAAIYTILFGALSEYYQDLFTSRLADVYDIIANAIGVALATLAILAFGTERLLLLARRLLRLGK